jgi:medium-chain acyl-[acyl-carrier-protein] hydrolase
VGYQRLLQEDKIWVLSRLLIEIESAPLWGETVQIVTWPRAAKSVFAMRDFEILNASGVRFLAGTTGWLIIDTHSRRPLRVDKLTASIEAVQDRRALAEEPEKLPDMPGGALSAQRFTARYSDIDVNKHVNNARYLGWLMDSYSFDFHEQHSLSRLEINYVGEAQAGQNISVSAVELSPGEFVHSINNAETNAQLCRAKVKWRTL